MYEARGPFVRRVVLRNYKSIKECNVLLGPLSLLVGLNGSGKSNFLDALRFVAECLRTTADQALRERGGIREVRRRSGGRPTHFAIDLELRLPQGGTGSYRFRVGAKPHGGFEVQEEDCRLATDMGASEWYRVRNGVVEDASFVRRPTDCI